MRPLKFRCKQYNISGWVMMRLQPREMTDPESFCQFTNLLDSDGKELYEGDVIESDRGQRHEIRYSTEQAAFIAHNLQNHGECLIDQKWINRYHRRIIGNIFDNPELTDQWKQNN
jgi:hypothetical protein